MDNLHAMTPVRKALGAHWLSLAPPIQRHYNPPCDRAEALHIEGTMQVFISRMGKCLIPIARLFKALVPYDGVDIPVTVRNWSRADTMDMLWHRTFHYPNKQPVEFCSHLEFLQGNEVVEYVGWGLGLRLQLSTEENALRFESCGYLWNLGIFKLPLPEWLFLGKAIIRETAISDSEITIEFDNFHPIWGKMFSYNGTFQLLGGDSKT